MNITGIIKGLKVAKNAGSNIADAVNRGQERKHGNVEKNAERSHEMDKMLLDYRSKFSSSSTFNAVAYPFIALLWIWFASPILKYIPWLGGLLEDYNALVNVIGGESLMLIVMSLLGIKKLGNAWQNGQLVSFAKKQVEVNVPTIPVITKKVGYDYNALIDKHFSKSSKDKLLTCHQDLQRIMAVACSKKDLTVIEGTRTLEQQMKYFADGKSKLDGVKKKSKHQSNPSMAVDVAPTPIDWNNKQAFYDLSKIIFDVSNELKQAGEISHRLRWGGDFNQDGDYTNDSFVDFPHFELC